MYFAWFKRTFLVVLSIFLLSAGSSPVFAGKKKKGSKAKPETQCKIEKPAYCPKQPKTSVSNKSVFYDSHENAHKNKDRCLRRAQDYFGWCGYSWDEEVRATFIKGTKVVDSKVAKRKNISIVELQGSGRRKLPRGLFGTNVIAPKDKNSDYQEYGAQKTFENLKLESLRFPGGGVSQEYLWKSNCMIDLQALNKSQQEGKKTNVIGKELGSSVEKLRREGCEKLHDRFDVPANNAGLTSSESFVSWLHDRNPNAEATFVVNVDSGSYENKLHQYAVYAGEWFEHINKFVHEQNKSLPDGAKMKAVLNWEIGNEIYLQNGITVPARKYARIFKVYQDRINEVAAKLKKKGMLAQSAVVNVVPIGPSEPNKVGFADKITEKGYKKYLELSLEVRKYCNGSDDGKDRFYEAARDESKLPGIKKYKISTTGRFDSKGKFISSDPGIFDENGEFRLHTLDERRNAGNCGGFRRDPEGVIGFYNMGSSVGDRGKDYNRAWWDVVGEELRGREVNLISAHIYDNMRVRGGKVNFEGSVFRANELKQTAALLKSKGVKGNLRHMITEWNVGSPANKAMTYREHVANIFEQLSSYAYVGVEHAQFWPMRIDGSMHTLLDFKTKAIKPAGNLISMLSRYSYPVLNPVLSKDGDLVSLGTESWSGKNSRVFMMNKSATSKRVVLKTPNRQKCLRVYRLNVANDQKDTQSAVVEVPGSSALKNRAAGLCEVQLDPKLIYVVESNT